jgi:hypothetical protein
VYLLTALRFFKAYTGIKQAPESLPSKVLSGQATDEIASKALSTCLPLRGSASQSEVNSRRHPAWLQCEHVCVSDRGSGKAGQNRQLEGDPACKAAFGGCRVGR